jgi:hypothetical protein
MVRRGLNYLRNWVNQDIKSMEDARNKAYAIYVLTRSGMVTSNEILHWLNYVETKKKDHWKTDLAAAYIAASYEMMQQKKLAAQTMDDFEKGVFVGEISMKNTSAKTPYYSPFVKYAQYTTILARHFPQRFARLDRDIVFTLADFINTQRYNTLSASYAIQALSDYTKGQEAVLTNVNVVFETEQGKDPALKTQNTITKRAIPSKTKRIVIESEPSEDTSAEPFFYTLNETGYSRDLSDDPVSQGLEIERTYRTSDGKALEDGSVAIGDIIEATIQVRAHGDDRIENVALVDLLPAGFALEPEGSGEGSTLFPEFVERREDRLMIFTDIAPREQVFHYKLRAVTKGEFQVPPPYAEAMYNLSKKARGHTGTIMVRDEAP